MTDAAGSGIELVRTGPLPYLLSLPHRARSRQGPVPVLCFLHGYDEAAPMEIRRALTLHGPLARTSAPEATEEFIVVAPQLPRAGDVWRRHAGDVAEIVREVHEQHAGDPQRTYLTGFSFGGNGVFDLALEHRGGWAALWAVDPTRVPVEDPERPVWLSFGEVARRRKDAFVDALELREASGEPRGDRVCLDQGEDHVGSARLAYGDGRIYRWLLGRRLD